jgi:hypothetical protein
MKASVVPRPTAETIRRGILILVVSAGAGALLAVLSSLAFQVALILAAAAAVATVVMVRTGRVLNPAFVIVAALYLIGPIGTILRQGGIGLSTVAVVMLAPSPFVLAALYTRRDSLDRFASIWPLAVLIVLGGVSLLWSPSPDYGLQKLEIWILAGLVPAAFILILTVASSRILWGVIALAACIAALALIGFGESSPLYPGRLALFGDNPIWTARAAFIGALVAVFGPFPRSAKWIMTPILIIAGLLTVSLGPVLGFLIGAWAGAVQLLWNAGRASDRARLGWIVLGIVTGCLLVVLLADTMFGGDASILAKVVVNDPNVTGRATFLDAALRLFLGSPLVGVGLGGFLTTGLIEYPHNLVAEIGSELGVIGLLALGAWFVLALRGALGSPILMALLVATAVYSLFSGSVASNVEFWMFSALAVASHPVRKRSVIDARQPDPIAHRQTGGALVPTRSDRGA